MRKSLLGFIICVSVFGLTGCGGNEAKIKAFAEDFGAKASNNQIDSLKLVYPTMRADSVALTFNADSISVTKAAEPGTFVINYGNGVIVNVAESEDGNVTVTSSKGLYAFPKEKKEIATKTGMIDETLVDNEIATRMKDEDFFIWLNKKIADTSQSIISLTASKSKIGACYGEGNYAVSMSVKLTNNSNSDIKGSDYDILYTKVYSGEESNNWRNTYGSGKQSGVDLKAGETRSVKLSAIHLESITKPTIVWNVNPSTLISPSFFTGNEYQDYLKNKSDKN